MLIMLILILESEQSRNFTCLKSCAFEIATDYSRCAIKDTGYQVSWFYYSASIVSCLLFILYIVHIAPLPVKIITKLNTYIFTYM